MILPKEKQAFMVSAMKSGSGKTLITLGLINILKKMGKTISIYKTGPDYIDTMYHEKIAGSPSTNLDPFFLEPEYRPEELKNLFFKNFLYDTAIIEGAMGLFDGVYGEGKRCSACIVSEEIGVDVILVVDMDELEKLEEYLNKFSHRVRAVIVNKLPPDCDIELLKAKINALDLVLLGYLYMDESYRIESRHLGLYEPQKDIFSIVERVSEQLEKSLDFDALYKFIVKIESSDNFTAKSDPKIPKYRLAFAYDEAFSFTYEENIEVLKEYGFDIVKFSPIHDKKLPDNINAIWLSGGYPELYAKELSSNTSMLNSIKEAKNIPIIAECGGFIYLHKYFEDNSGETFEGVGLIDGKAFKTQKLVRFGYIEIEAKSDSFLMKKNQKIRSHEFHYFDSTNNGEYAHAVKANKSKEWNCINAYENIFAGFPHIYLRGYEFLVENLVEYLERQRNV
ncbi:cobyrinic acid a,c-diamide synthase [Lachnoanaerobaculum sp. ICM7]|uniref:cobyrinate a,c-diamide synthase n=1 Tax=Lachnoanaerobaculum sp. ICM7 TaxID=936594 RepID=UPI00027A63ED|nr:cobyrinate a,c-diamide synthase [Lachnoanaerobaculum sp. ICM7]EJP24671.1 cobyrinic acid a,c-diamide synthase [Lachnoanaerobaculum sp. ICM7]